ncbi:MAG: uroporphyrinogen-III C-methyltransferase, partial [Planctomycetaceae bacterium]
MDPPPEPRRQRSKGTRPTGADGPQSDSPSGTVFFVGAGPGDHHLLTLRAAELLEMADAVVHDRLVHPSVVAMAGARARLIQVPSDGPDVAGSHLSGELAESAAPVCKGRAVGEMLVALCRRHTTVVRLKGGDPTIFARLAEETEALTTAGIPWQVIPGITAAMAAAAAARIPLTSRSSASSITLMTGHEALGKSHRDSVSHLAAAGGTLVIYMGIERAGEWSAALARAGRHPTTPVVLISHGGCPEEIIVWTTLAEVPLAIEGMSSPTVAIIGEVIAEGPQRTQPPATSRSFLAAAPSPPSAGCDRRLDGRRILVPRPAGTAPDMINTFRAHGAECLEIPVIRIEPPETWGPLDDAIDCADQLDWIVFSSIHGARSFAQRLRQTGHDGRDLATVRLAAVGATTAAELLSLGLACDLFPSRNASADALADLLLASTPESANSAFWNSHSNRGRQTVSPRSRFLLVRADRGRDVLRTRLEAAGHTVIEACGYRSIDVESLPPEIERCLSDRPVDWLVLTSPSVARGVARLFPAHLRKRTLVASISPLTSTAAREVGIQPDVEAVTPSTAA